MRGFFPFDTLRVRMTVGGRLGEDEALVFVIRYMRD